MGDAACWAGDVCPTCGRILQDGRRHLHRPLLLLVGLMGAGKTTVGREVAERLGWRFVDNDELFAARTGTTAAAYAAEHGDAAMHRLEWELVAEVVEADEPTVLAAPGSVVDAPSLDLDDVFVVWLDVDPAVIAGRIAVGDHRPLLGNEPEPVLRSLLEERAASYRALADLVLEATDATPSQLAARIVDAWEQRQPDAGA